MKRKPLQSFLERGHARVARTFFCGSLFGLCIFAGAAEADPMVEFIIEQFQERCDAGQAEFRGIDDDLDAPLAGALTLSADSIYDLQLTPDGVKGKVVYNNFRCTNMGSAWCGSGGCGFHIVVNGVAFYRQGGFRPQSVTVGSDTFILIPIHGGGCVTSEGNIGAGVDPCYVVATWDAKERTFRSKGGEIDLSPLNP